MEWFCTEEERSALKVRERRLTAAFRILAGITFAVFVILCLLIRTENAGAMHLLLIAVTTILGWICIIIYQCGVRESRVHLRHLDMLLAGEKCFREGRLTVTGESIQIPRSIRIRKVLLDTGEAESERLNLDERWISRIPPDGCLARLAVVCSYIAGAEKLEDLPDNTPGHGVRRKTARIRPAAKLLPLLGIWALTVIIFGSFVFYQLTDTDPAHKLTIYVDGEIRNEAQLAARIEQELEASVRMVQIRPFRYAMFGSEALKSADLFIVPDSDSALYADWFAAGEDAVPVYDPETGVSIADAWILYPPEEVSRLYIGAASPHLADGLARRGAELLMIVGAEKEEDQ